MKKNFLLLFLFFYQFLFSQTNIIKQTFFQIKNNYCFANAQISFYVIDSLTNKVIFAYNSNKILKPASTLKILSTAAALETFGKDYRFKTIVFYKGHIDTNGILEGDIIIKGYGDPTLNSKYFDNDFFDTVIYSIEKAGIKKIKGKIIADASYFDYQLISPKWNWEDIGNYYAAGISALSCFDNSYTLHFRTSGYAGGKTYIWNISPEIPNLKIKNYVRASNINRDNAYIYGSPYTYERTIRGTLPKGRRDFKVKGSIPDPSYFCAYHLFKIFKSNNIEVDTFTTVRLMNDSTYSLEGATKIISIHSPPLIDIIEKTNLKSINLFAEYLARNFVLQYCGSSQWDSLSKYLKKFWVERGLEENQIFVYDGSGLSTSNLISSKNMVKALQHISSKDYASDFFKTLPISGKKGTLKYYCKNSQAKGRIFAKTGTLSRVKAFAGYAHTINNQTLIFAIIINNYTCKHRYAKKYFEKILNSLVLYKE